MSDKLLDILKSSKLLEGVYVLSEYNDNPDFEATYIRLREKENRIHDDQTIAELPYPKNVEQVKEWQMRARSAERVLNYFRNREGEFLLDLGCGNGWFTSLLAKDNKMKVFGVDLNRFELEQAARIFQTENLYFLFAEIFKTQLPEKEFDFITLNASVQYFDDFKKLVFRLFELLKDDGEIHIIDSPFYNPHEIEDARNRTRQYYKDAGFEKMADFYFHRSFEDLEAFNFKVLYQPAKWSLVAKLLGKHEIPFPWIRITK